jgi:hypothetical protein
LQFFFVLPPKFLYNDVTNWKKEGYSTLATKHELMELIEKKRSELIDIVAKYGMSSSKTLKLSQELDTLLNKYNHIIVPK